MSERTITQGEYDRQIAESVRRKEVARRLQKRVEELEKQQKELEANLARAEDGLKKSEAEIKGWQAKYETAPDEWRAKYEEATKQLKGRDLRAMFDKAARGKVRDDALDAAWTLSGISADVEIDEKGVGEAVSSLVSGHAFLSPVAGPADSGSRGADDSASAGTRYPAASPGPGYQRGSVNGGGSGNLDTAVAQMRGFLDQTGRGSNPGRLL